MMKKYKTWEASKMLTEDPKLKFQKLVGGKPVPVFYFAREHGGQGHIFSIEATNGYGHATFTDTEWILFQEPVSFMEAIRAHENGKRIISKSGTIKHEYSWKDGILLDESENPVTINEILYFGWYIEEDSNE